MLYLVINFAVITGIAVFVNYWIIFGSFIGLYLEEMTENGEMIGVDDLLVSTGVQKALRVNFPKINSYAFGELWEMEYLDLVNLLSKAGLAPSVEELKIYDKDLSYLIYDDKNKIRAMILVRKYDGGYFVDLLFGSTKESQYIMTAAQRFVLALKNRSTGDDSRITMLATKEVILPLLQRVLDKGTKIDEMGLVHFVRLEEEDKELAEALFSAEEGSFCQANIARKVPRNAAPFPLRRGWGSAGSVCCMTVRRWIRRGRMATNGVAGCSKTSGLCRNGDIAMVQMRCAYGSPGIPGATR